MRCMKVIVGTLLILVACPWQNYLASNGQLGAQERNSLKARIQGCLERRYTLQRLRQFCRPETRCLFAAPNMPAGDLLSGRLYPGFDKDPGQINWVAVWSPKQPCVFMIQVLRQNRSYWRINGKIESFEAPYTKETFDEDFLRAILSNAILSYVFVHRKELTEDKHPQYPKKVLALISKGNPEKRQLTAKLNNGQTLTATVDDHFELSNILVDYSKDQLWDCAYSERLDNIDKVFKSRLAE